MADDFFDSAFDDIFEDLADFATAFPLPTPTTFPQFGALPLPPPDFPGLCPRRLGANPPPLFGPFSSSPANPAARFGIGLSYVPFRPAHPTNRHSLTPRHPASPNPPTLQPTLPSLLRPAASSNSASAPAPAPAADSPSAWGLSSVTPVFGATSSFGRREPGSDDYDLNQLLTRNFSSPSLLNEDPRSPSNAEHTALRASRLPTTATTASGSGTVSQASGSGNGDIKREAPAGDDELSSPLWPLSPLPTAYNPQGTTNQPSEMSARRKRAAAGAEGLSVSETGGLSFPSVPARASRSQQIAQQETGQTSRKRSRAEFLKSEDDIFGEEDIKVVDLANTEQVPASLTQPGEQKPKNETKLSAFQCVICMDDVTNLTVTHCGHLFCGECLHSSLHIDTTKKVCPICRQKIDARPASGKFSQKARGYYPLELKLTTKKSLGKRTAQ